MRDFEFLEPASLADACSMIHDLGEDCRVIAGGTALMLAMRQRMLTPAYLVSIARLDMLRGIAYDPLRGLRIGALTLHADVAASSLVQQHYPMLAQMAAHMANPQVRNQGTIGGNLCYADPATDPPGCLMALDAQIVLRGRKGERALEVDEFLVDYYTTALASDELVTEIRIPPSRSAGHYVRYLRTAAEHRPLANVAVRCEREGGACHEARLVVGASTAVPTRITRAEEFLQGRPMTQDAAAEAASIVAADIDPLSDMRGSADYRREVVEVVVRRALVKLFCLSESQQGTWK
jgi:carbon-monoxide dehydrogenase medium subunit